MSYRVQPVGLDLVMHDERMIAIFRVFLWPAMRFLTFPQKSGHRVMLFSGLPDLG